MFYAARTFAMKLGQSLAMLLFTSLATIGAAKAVAQTAEAGAQAAGSPFEYRIVALVAAIYIALTVTPPLNAISFESTGCDEPS